MTQKAPGTEGGPNGTANRNNRENQNWDREDEAWYGRPKDPDANFKPLTAEEAQRLRAQRPQISPWRVIAGQIVAGLVVALVAWGLTGQQSVAWSAGYGALAVVVPAAVFARGLTNRLASLNASTAVMAFFVWEMVKLALTVAMLFAAPRLIAPLSWPAMLVGLLVALQAYWAVVVFAPGRRQ